METEQAVTGNPIQAVTAGRTLQEQVDLFAGKTRLQVMEIMDGDNIRLARLAGVTAETAKALHRKFGYQQKSLRGYSMSAFASDIRFIFRKW